MDCPYSATTRSAWICLLLLIPTVTAIAQPADLPGRLSFEDARALFLAHNPDLKAARAEAKRRTQEARIPALWPNPVLSARRNQVRIPGGGISSENTLALEQPLRYPGEHRARRRAARARSTAAEAHYIEDAAALYRMLRTRYAEALAASLRVEAKAAITTAVRRAIEIAEARYEEGDIGALDRSRLRVAQATYEDALEEARKDDEDALIELAYVLQPRSHAGHHEAEEERTILTDTLAYRPVAPNYEALVEAALERRGLTAAAQAERRAREQTLRAERYARLPDLALAAGYRGETQPGVISSGFMVRLRVGLPAFHQNQARVRASDAGAEVARYAIEQVQRRIELDVHDAYERLRSYQHRIETISGELLAGTDRLLENALYVYAEGELDLVELLDAIEAAQTARLLQIDLLLGHALSRYDLERALGVGPTDPSPFASSSLE